MSDMDQICLGKDQGDHFGFFNGKRAYRLCERLVDWLDEKDDTMKFNQVALGYGGSVVAVGDLGVGLVSPDREEEAVSYIVRFV